MSENAAVRIRLLYQAEGQTRRHMLPSLRYIFVSRWQSSFSYQQFAALGVVNNILRVPSVSGVEKAAVLLAIEEAPKGLRDVIHFDGDKLLNLHFRGHELVQFGNDWVVSRVKSVDRVLYLGLCLSVLVPSIKCLFVV